MNKIRQFFHKMNENKNITGVYIKKYQRLYIALLCIVSLFEIVMFVRGFFLFSFEDTRHYCYMISYVTLFLVTVPVIAFLFTIKKKNYSDRCLSIVMNFYTTFFVLWSAFVSVLDIMGSHYPIVYLTIIVTMGGAIVLDPILYSLIVLLSASGMMIACNYVSMSTVFTNGDIFNLLVFMVMAMFVAYRNFITSAHEKKSAEHLKELSYKDMLTGLGNETAYFELVDEYTSELKQNEFRFAVLVMDVNGLKNTDDTYGHRFGSHLIATAGEKLNQIFQKSHCFHVGGDEFVIIVREELDDLDKLREDFRHELEYQIIEFENKKLVLSLAIGVSVHQNGETYGETFQRADDDMYLNKKAVKEQYHIAGR